MEQAKYKAYCPICGKCLFKGTPNSKVEVFCPKCNGNMQVSFTSNGVSIAEISRDEHKISAAGQAGFNM